MFSPCVIDDAIQHTPWRVQHALRVQHCLPNGMGLYGGRTLLASVAQRGIHFVLHFVLGGQGLLPLDRHTRNRHIWLPDRYSWCAFSVLVLAAAPCSMPNAIDVDGRRGLTQLPRVSLSTLGRLATELSSGLRHAVTLQVEAFAPLQGPPMRGEQFTISYGMQEMSLCMSIAALMLLKSAAHLSVVDQRTALAIAPARRTARADVVARAVRLSTTLRCAADFESISAAIDMHNDISCMP